MAADEECASDEAEGGAEQATSSSELQEESGSEEDAQPHREDRDHEARPSLYSLVLARVAANAQVASQVVNAVDALTVEEVC